MCGITYPNAERAKALASGLPDSCQIDAVLVADDGQVRPEHGYGLQGTDPLLSGAERGVEQIGDPSHPGGGLGDDPGDQVAVAAAGQNGAARVGQQFRPNSGPRAGAPRAHAASHRPSCRALVTQPGQDVTSRYRA